MKEMQVGVGNALGKRTDGKYALQRFSVNDEALPIPDLAEWPFVFDTEADAIFMHKVTEDTAVRVGLGPTQIGLVIR